MGMPKSSTPNFHAIAGETRFALCAPLPQGCASCATWTGATWETSTGGRKRYSLFWRGAGAWGRFSAGRHRAGHQPSGLGRAGREGLQSRPRAHRHRHQNHHGRRRSIGPVAAAPRQRSPMPQRMLTPLFALSCLPSMLWIISVSSTVLPTPAAPNRPDSPPVYSGTSTSIIFMPVSKITDLVERRTSGGGSR